MYDFVGLEKPISQPRPSSRTVGGEAGHGEGMDHLESKNKSLTLTQRPKTILSYPENVGTDPQQAHYILFSISTFIKGKFGKVTKGTTTPDKMDSGLDYLSNETSSEAVAAVGAGATKNKSLTLTNRPLVKLNKTIALYMPASVTTSYNLQYNDQEIGQMADIGMDIFNAITGNATGGGLIDKVSKKAGTAAHIMGVKVLDMAAPGVKALEALHQGRIITPRMELMFEGLGRRTFNYTFTFIPKNEKESMTVKEIIKTFKIHMHPEMEANSREFYIPDVFDIKYMYINKENDFLHKISTCYCTSMNVTYGADKYTTYDPGPKGSPPPQQTVVALTFQELELIDRDKVEMGF
tara:strand:+ start:134 stop:1186 length:1053 start_codon:yes stop_codon:yes gene_type:complete